MWEKITSINQLEILDAEDVLMKYPLDGKVAGTFEKANPENVLPRVVVENNYAEQTIRLGFIHSRATGDPILGMHVSSIMAPVDKKYADIISDGVWWKFVEE